MTNPRSGDIERRRRATTPVMGGDVVQTAALLDGVAAGIGLVGRPEFWLDWPVYVSPAVQRSYPGACGLHRNQDIAVYEPVDAGNRPVAPGTRPRKFLVTRVINHVLPLIRYEVAVLVGPSLVAPVAESPAAYRQFRKDVDRSSVRRPD